MSVRRTILGLAALVATAAVVASARPLAQGLIEALEWFRSAGALGVVAFLSIYALGTWALVPASWLQGASGVLFGPVIGTLVALVSSTLAGSVSFLLGRTVLAGPVRRWSPARWLAALDHAVSERGLVAVLLVRMTPVTPFNLLNYALGATRLRLRDFVLGTLIGGIVPSLLWAVVGASASDLAAVVAGEASGPGWVRWVGLACTLVAVTGLSLLARRSFRALPAPDPAS